MKPKFETVVVCVDKTDTGRTLRFDEISENSNYIFQYLQGEKHRRLSAVWHTHDFYEWLVILKGNNVHNVNNKLYKLEKDEVLLLKPGDFHDSISQSPDVTALCLSVKREEFEKMCYVFDLSLDKERKATEPIIFGSPEFSARFYSMFQNAEALTAEQDYRLLLSYLVKAYVDIAKTETASMPLWLAETLKEMRRPENVKEGVSALMRISNYSQSRLSRLMQEHLSMSLHEYVLRLRLEAAHKELVLTTKSIEQISEDVGYASFSHFQKIFKREYGITPAKLRAKHSSWTM